MVMDYSQNLLHKYTLKLTSKNTFLIDETPEKAMYNLPGSLIKAPGFEGDEDDDYFERLNPYLWNLYWFPGYATDYVWSHHLM